MARRTSLNMRLGKKNVMPRPKTSAGRLAVNPGTKHKTGRGTTRK